MAKTYNETFVWQKAHRLVLEIYRATSSFPTEEKFGLVSQMRRAAVSVPSNFVEGFKRKGYRDGLNFFNISEASLEELRYQTLLAHDLNYIPKNEFEELKKLQDDVASLFKNWTRSYIKTAS